MQHVQEYQTGAAVVGGGIAGVWAALKLVRHGVPTVLIAYDRNDRGGAQGASIRSVGAINTAPIVLGDNFAQQFEEITSGQANPTIGSLLARHLAKELDDLREFTDLEAITLGYKPAGHDPRSLLALIKAEFQQRGGRLIDGWVSRIVASPRDCRGLQYQTPAGTGKVRCRHLVLAAGGYAGLFAGSVQTACHGTGLGQYLRCGGVASNLEFIFRHGFGKPDAGKLTPTEELRGAEICDEDGNHVQWLEQALYIGKGTQSHQAAISFWRQHGSRKFFVNADSRPLFTKVEACNAWMKNPGAVSCGGGPEGSPVTALLELFPAEKREAVRQRVELTLEQDRAIDYELYCELRAQYTGREQGKQWDRIRHIPYFSMGGAAHDGFRTNLCNVFVNGEIMDDFGANRVGGLPWGLYLVAGELIAQQVAAGGGGERPVGATDFELVECPARFDPATLDHIRKLLNESLEGTFSEQAAEQACHQLQTMRRKLASAEERLDDSVAWLIVAEAVLRSAMLRRESRGCFFREDLPAPNAAFNDHFTFASYDDRAGDVTVRWVHRTEYLTQLRIQREEAELR